MVPGGLPGRLGRGMGDRPLTVHRPARPRPLADLPGSREIGATVMHDVNWWLMALAFCIGPVAVTGADDPQSPAGASHHAVSAAVTAGRCSATKVRGAAGRCTAMRMPRQPCARRCARCGRRCTAMCADRPRRCTAMYRCGHEGARRWLHAAAAGPRRRPPSPSGPWRARPNGIKTETEPYGSLDPNH